MAAPSTAEPHVGRMQFLLDLRRRGIMDANVLRAMDEVPREQFVMPNQVKSAYSDRAMPIACGQSISQPYVVAYMTEQLDVEPQHHILEIGTGSGYQAAVLSRLAKQVTSIERYRTLAEAARSRLQLSWREAFPIANTSCTWDWLRKPIPARKICHRNWPFMHWALTGCAPEPCGWSGWSGGSSRI